MAVLVATHQCLCDPQHSCRSYADAGQSLDGCRCHRVAAAAAAAAAVAAAAVATTP